MRTGSWLITAGLILLAVGIVSVPESGRESNERSQTFPMAGVDTLHIESSSIDRILLDTVPDATMRYMLWHRSTDEPTFAQSITDGVMTLKNDSFYFNNASLTVPTALESLRGPRLSLIALHPAGELRVEGVHLNWERGNAKTLDIHLNSSSSPCSNTVSSNPTFTFSNGSVELLRIHARTGTVILEYVDQVGDIELHAGPSVRVQARHSDLSRIRILPLATTTRDTPLTPPFPCGKDTAAELNIGP